MGRSIKKGGRRQSKELYACPRCHRTRVVIRGRMNRAMGHVKTMFCAKCGRPMMFTRVA